MSQLSFFSYPEDLSPSSRRKCDGGDSGEEEKMSSGAIERQDGGSVTRRPEEREEQKQCNFYDVSQAITYFLLDAISGHPRPSSLFPVRDLTHHANPARMRIACQTTAAQEAKERAYARPANKTDRRSLLLLPCVCMCLTDTVFLSDSAKGKRKKIIHFT